MAGYMFPLGVDGTVHALLPPRLSLVLVCSPFHFHRFSLFIYANFPCSRFDRLQPFDVTSSQCDPSLYKYLLTRRKMDNIRRTNQYFDAMEIHQRDCNPGPQNKCT